MYVHAHTHIHASTHARMHACAPTCVHQTLYTIPLHHPVDPLKETDKWVDDPPISVEEVVGIEESPMPGYSSFHDYDPLGIAIDEARVDRNKLPVEQVESLYPDGMFSQGLFG